MVNEKLIKKGKYYIGMVKSEGSWKEVDQCSEKV